MKSVLNLKPTRVKLIMTLMALGMLSGCASVSLEQNMRRINAETQALSGGQLNLAQSHQEREQRALLAANLLSKPIGQAEAVQLALTNSHALQALLAQGWAESADAAQTSRIANPIFSFERMAVGDGLELELARSLSLGLLDLLTLPAKVKISKNHIEQAQLRLASSVVDHLTQVRQAWVRAVTAQQLLAYAHQVFESAEAGAELARRMQSVGNLNRISRAREQAFYADAATRLATAQQLANSTREELVRLLGLDEVQAQALKLPERLPDLPQEPIQATAISVLAPQSRLDIRLAQHALAAAGKAQGLNLANSFTDIELKAKNNSKFENDKGTRTSASGYEVSIRLPIFDWGAMQRDAWNARTLAAANQLEATFRSAGSHLRESYFTYRTALDIAKHHRDEVVPLRRIISDENQLRYNGMLIDVFELLADARDQISVVTDDIAAQQQFWIADAALQASLIGRPSTTSDTPLSVMPSAPSADTAGH